MIDSVAHGMNWLHLPTTVLHLDLKLENVLVDARLRLRIADFGFAAVKQSQVEYLKGNGHVIGNLLHKAPELLRDDPFDEHADVYSFGILAWEVLNGGDWDSCVTEAERNAAGSNLSVLEASFKRAVLAGRRPHRLASIPAPVYDLLGECWHTDSARRPLFPQLLPRIADAKLEATLGLDARGVAFWRAAFGSDDLVQWPTFASRLYAALRIDLSASTNAAAELAYIDEHVRALVDPEDTQQARAENFGRLLRAFGPMPKCTPSNPSTGRRWLDDMCRVIEQPWFYGNLSAEDAIRALRGQAIGTFLVRFSSDETIPFTVSVVADDSHCEHIRVHRVAGRLSAEGLRLYSLNRAATGNAYSLPSLLESRASDSSERFVGGSDSGRMRSSGTTSSGSELSIDALLLGGGGAGGGGDATDEEQFSSIADLVDAEDIRSDLSFLVPCVPLRSHFQALRSKKMTHDYK
jgi:serine/threonine protein kinase